MAMRYVEGELRATGDLRDVGFADRIAGILEERGSDVDPRSKPRGLEPRRFEIRIPTVSEEIYVETRKAVEKEIPGVFITAIRPVSIKDLLAEDIQRGQRGEPRRLGYVNSSRTMRATLPPAMEVFIDPNNFKIDGSNRLSTDAQKVNIAERAAEIRSRLPEALRSNVDWHMVDPATMSQLEDAWMDAGRGLLFPDFFARTDIQTVQGFVALVGRSDPTHRRYVRDWLRDLGHDDVFAVAVGVLPRKLTA